MAGFSGEEARQHFVSVKLNDRLAELEQHSTEAAAERAVIRRALQMLQGQD